MSARASGFSLIEVLVATSVLAAVLVGVAHVSAMATRANQLARLSTQSAALAAGKMEELRAVPWTDLDPTPSETLSSNQDGYFEFTDVAGRVLEEHASISASRAYVRRWAVTSITSSLRLIEVMASPWPDVRGAADAGSPPGSAHLISVRGAGE